MNKWTSVSSCLPPENTIVLTKIDDEKGTRNVSRLFRKGNLWFIPNADMYVYYTPTHWRNI